VSHVPDFEWTTYTQGQELNIWVLVVETTFESAHGILCWGGFGTNLVAYFEIEGNVLGTSGE